MNLLAWNVNHRTCKKKIPPEMGDAIAAVAPDIISLTEYVSGPSHERFIADLASTGLVHTVISTVTPRQNSVLIASRTPLLLGEIQGPPICPSLPSNVLHVVVPNLDLEVSGLRVPDYSKTPALRRDCWDWILATAREVCHRPFVLLGDLNTDPDYPRSRCGDRLDRMETEGWQRAKPAGSSYWTVRGGEGRRLDHAFVTGHFRILRSAYITESGPFTFAGKGSEAISDHAALLVELSRQPDDRTGEAEPRQRHPDLESPA